MSLHRLILSLLVAVGLSSCAIVPGDGGQGETTRWTMLMVSPKDDVADCHLIRLPDGRKVLIDAGKLGDSPGAALAAVQAQNITALDLVILSHFHIDHYGALWDLIEAGITIKRVVINVPVQAAADQEKGWGCNLDHVRATLTKLDDHHIPYFTPKTGERILETTTAQGTVVALDVICLYDGLNSPIGLTDVNETSMIVRLSHGSTRALFTGDLGGRLGAYLATSNFDLKADILKVPHHGAEGCAPNEFFDRVGAKAVLVPAPKNLWASGRSMRIRNYFIEHRIPTYVSALRGNVTAVLTATDFRIESER